MANPTGDEEKGININEVLSGAVSMGRMVAAFHRNLILEGIERQEATYLAGVYIEAMFKKPTITNVTHAVDPEQIAATLRKINEQGGGHTRS